MRISHFNQAELAFRWRISPRTLERWRCSNTVKILAGEDLKPAKSCLRSGSSPGGAVFRIGKQQRPCE